VQVVDRWQRAPNQAFAEVYEAGKPILPQIEKWARAHNVVLETPGWKVELAKRTKQAFLARPHPQFLKQF
jgi:hypothetical protein